VNSWEQSRRTCPEEVGRERKEEGGKTREIESDGEKTEEKLGTVYSWGLTGKKKSRQTLGTEKELVVPGENEARNR